MNLHACDIRYRKVQTTDLTMDGCAITPALGDANWEQVALLLRFSCLRLPN